MSKLEQAVKEVVKLNNEGRELKFKRNDFTYGDLASGKASKAKAAQTINNKRIAAALTKVSIALEEEREEVKKQKLADKTYYDGLAASYLTPDELKFYYSIVHAIDKNATADKHNSIAKNTINKILKPYNIDIDSITISPKDWPEYKKIFNDYKSVMTEDNETKALREAARKKDALQNKVYVPKGKELFEEAIPVLGLKSDDGKAQQLKPLMKYKKSITGDYEPVINDDDDFDKEDWDDYSVDFNDESEKRKNWW